MAISLNDDPSRQDDEKRLLWEGGFSAKSMWGAWIGASFVSALIVAAVPLIDQLSENRLVWLTMCGLIGLIWMGLAGLVLYQN